MFYFYADTNKALTSLANPVRWQKRNKIYYDFMFYGNCCYFIYSLFWQHIKNSHALGEWGFFLRLNHRLNNTSIEASFLIIIRFVWYLDYDPRNHVALKSDGSIDSKGKKQWKNHFERLSWKREKRGVKWWGSRGEVKTKEEMIEMCKRKGEREREWMAWI